MIGPDLPDSLLKALLTAIAVLFGILIRWMRGSINECRDDRSKLRTELKIQNTKITSLAVETEGARREARHARDLAQKPCILPECPKRGT